MTLDDLTPGARVSGLLPGGRVTVVAVRWHGPDALAVTYEDEDGGVGQRILYRGDAHALEPAADTTAFDADAGLFRLAAEALRIRTAGQHDPMLAVTTSDLEPLPHQIQAVYGDLLPRVPLRYLLADDPGAGKTIMAGLYIKELALRGDLARCLVVAPGGLVEQWQDELFEKFGLRFDVLSPEMAAASPAVFENHPLLIARMDQLARNDELLAQLDRTEWDLAVVDEAHRMSASYFGHELKATRRYQLGRLLGRTSRNFLLMTATPHAGDEEDFQLFLALLDPDRFEGRAKTIDLEGVMCRRVKEELLTFEGKPLFPERRAYTVPYELSEAEHGLYEAVTRYVRTEMNRADELKQSGEGNRGHTVGFALTVLQRRLASSPEAILRSLERRQERLETRLHGTAFTVDSFESSEEEEVYEDLVVDAATAARTTIELHQEIEVVRGLAVHARAVRHCGTDRKWNELCDLLTSDGVRDPTTSARHRIIIFTEHRDTLRYLVERITKLVGSGVVAIHGGMSRAERRSAQHRFTHDADCSVLVATDAAGEGLNLQQAHLMVNYDLPWNPNRIEQRFGRIHRIGQTEVCHLWNLVAVDTREGDVFHRLLEKVEQQRKAYRGKVFDVLGEAFEGAPLRSLLIEAIRYGDLPEVRAQLHTVIDERVGAGLDELMAERSLHRGLLTGSQVEHVRIDLEEARIARLQPDSIRAFFADALTRAGGRLTPREAGRFEIAAVPTVLRGRRGRSGGTVLPAYARVCFDRTHIRGAAVAELLAPGHPLFDAVTDVTVERYERVLTAGTVLVDRSDPGDEVRMLAALREEVIDGHRPPRTVSKRFGFVELLPGGEVRATGSAPYLDYEVPSPDDLSLLGPPALLWSGGSPREQAVSWSVEHGMPAHLEQVRSRTTAEVDRTRTVVRQRLGQEVEHWRTESQVLAGQVLAGRKVRLRPDTAAARARDLERRLAARLAELDLDLHLQARPPVPAALALVVPYGLLERLRTGRVPTARTYRRDTREVEMRAVHATLAAERALGRRPEVMPHNNPGFDIRSRGEDGRWVFIEVKGRTLGAEDFHVTRTEVLKGKNAERYRLSLVSVHPDGAAYDDLRYLEDPFCGVEFDDLSIASITWKWREKWGQGAAPH